jgi:2,3-bisphosphoglycerate-independent phosphoglycerate mutase
MTSTADSTTRPRPVVLCVLDGWGHRPNGADNAIWNAKTPNYDRLMATCPHALLETSGLAVGLPDGQMGNSEVGHMNLGGGRVVMQDLPRIDRAVASGELAREPALVEAIQALKANGGTLHLLGLLSPGGVHSHQDHMAALARVAAEAGVPVAVHAFLDGRDTPPQSAKGFVAKFLGDVARAPGVRIATISGRYYAMDRDKRWDRVQLAYEALVDGKGQQAADAQAAIDQSYAAGKTDEFVLPTAIAGFAGMKDGDGLVMANFRADRAREILTALVDPAFDGFHRARLVRFIKQVGMVSYSAALDPFLPAIFPPERVDLPLGDVVSKAGLKQLRIAETEKYAHVTFFFNGGEETVFPGEDRILVPSPKVATYDLEPEMAAPEVTDRLVEAIRSNAYDLVVVNFANPDMVGHTGIMQAAIKAVQTIDESLGRLAGAVEERGGVMLITADHGNIEQMLDPVTGEPHTAHTTNLVPVILVGAANAARVLGHEVALENGRLADIAPTLLKVLKLPQPAQMTGHSLLKPAGAARQEHRATA